MKFIHNFNLRIEELNSSTKEELKKMKDCDAKEMEVIKKVHDSLNAGIKAIKRQKLIKVVDTSKFVWATVQHYDSRQIPMIRSAWKRQRRKLKENLLGASRAQVEKTDTAEPSIKRRSAITQPTLSPSLMLQGQHRTRVL